MGSLQMLLLLLVVVLKSTDVRPSIHVVARSFGTLEVHSESQADVRQAGVAVLEAMGTEESARQRPKIASSTVIRHVDPYQSALINKTRGGLDRAEEMYQKSLAINKKLDRQKGMAIQYGNLGSLAQAGGDLPHARELWTKARELYAKIGMKPELEQVQGWLDELAEEENGE